MKFSRIMLFLALAFAILMLSPVASAAFNWTHPANNEIITSPSVYLNLQSGTAQDCFFNYNGVKNVSVSCDGITMVRLPPVSGVYNLTVIETFPGTQTTTREITLSMPSGIVITSYSFLFITLLFCLVFLALYAFGKLVTLEFDLLDLCLNIGAFFALLFFQAMNLQYFGSEYINDWLLLIIKISTWTNVILPFLAIIMVMVLGPFLRLKYPRIFARMPGGGNQGQMPDPSSLGAFARGA